MAVDPKTFHDTLRLERFLKATPKKVFEHFKNPMLRSKWFKAPGDYQTAEQSIDFRIGGKEVLRGRFPSGTTTSYEATFYDIVENQRIVVAYDLLINSKRFSVSLNTVELFEENGGTRIVLTEQNCYIDAPQDAHSSRIHGISVHLDNLEVMF